MTWLKAESIRTSSFVCGFCGEKISSQLGYLRDREVDKIYICHCCDCPNVFFSDSQYPGEQFGNKVENLPENIESLYDEARECVGIQAYAATVMECRKILMHIAVEKGAKEGESFKQYVEYLDSKGYVPPDGKEWVDHIRDIGNVANHEIRIMVEENAKDLITFLEMLLKFIYEFPGKITKRTSKKLSSE